MNMLTISVCILCGMKPNYTGKFTINKKLIETDAVQTISYCHCAYGICKRCVKHKNYKERVEKIFLKDFLQGIAERLK